MKITDILKSGEESLPINNDPIPESKNDESDEEVFLNSRNAFISRIQKQSLKDKKTLISFKQCLNFCKKKVSISRRIWVPPYPKRGQKGFILEERAIDLFPESIKEVFLKNKDDKGLSLVLFYMKELSHEWVMVLLNEDLKILKK